MKKIIFAAYMLIGLTAFAQNGNANVNNGHGEDLCMCIGIGYPPPNGQLHTPPSTPVSTKPETEKKQGVHQKHGQIDPYEQLWLRLWMMFHP